MRSPVFKQTARTKQYGGATKEIQNAVGAGALDSPLYINVFSGRRRRRPLPRYREIVHFFSAEGLCEHNTGGASPSPTEIDGDRLFVRRRMIVRTMLRAINDRPYKRNSSKRRRGDHWSPAKTKRREQNNMAVQRKKFKMR